MLEPVARHLTGLRAYARPDREAASVWVAELHGARLLVALSPHFSRGFSGEGGLLDALADEPPAIEADFLDRALHGRWARAHLARRARAHRAVRLDPARCSCPWRSKHPGDRGPGKHLLAARLAAAQRVPAP